MEIIQSKDNSIIKEAKRLKERKHREDKGKFLIEGIRFVEEAVKSGVQIERIFISNELLDKGIDLLDNIKLKYQVHIVKDSLINEISNTESPQGIVAVIDKISNDNLGNEGFYVLADRLQDPGNMGTLIRTAHAAGAAGVLYTTGTVDPYNDKTLRSTMGSIFYMPLFKDDNLMKIRRLKEEGYKLVVSSLSAEHDFYDVRYDKKVIIAVGNEGNGVSDYVLNLADISVKIPMPGGAESLNASVAASIMIYEVLRQNRI